MLDDPEASHSELTETELACIKESGIRFWQTWAFTLGGSGNQEERVKIIGCLEDETTARIFLADIAQGVGPLTLETSTCIRAAFNEIDPRSMLLAKVEGFPEYTLNSATTAWLVTLACLSDDELRTAAKSLREDSGLRELMRCMMEMLGGPGEMAAAMTKGEEGDQKAFAEAAAGCGEEVEPTPGQEDAGPPPVPMVDIQPGHPAASLSLLPDSMMYAYINLNTVARRPDIQEHVEFQLAHFVSRDELPFAEELLTSIGAGDLLLSYQFHWSQWAIILEGDFTRVAGALAGSSQSGDGLSVSVADTHRDVVIYELVRTKSSGYQTEIYLAVLDSGALAASPDPDAVRDIIDRQTDGGRLPKGLDSMVEGWGLGDFLMAFRNESHDDQAEPLNAQRIYAFQAELTDGSDSIFRALQWFDAKTQAEAAIAWLQQQTEKRYFRIGWGDSVPIDQCQLKGTAVFGEAIVADEDLPHLVQGN